MKRTIVFVINSLGYGGAERVLCRVLEAAGDRRERYAIHVVLLDREPRVRGLPPFVVEHRLDSREKLLGSVRSLRSLLRKLKPDLVVSFLVRANVATALASRNRYPAILCERMHLSSHLDGRYRGLKRWLTGVVPRLAYRTADVVLGVSRGVTSDLVDRFAVRPARARTIHNPYDLEAIKKEGSGPTEIDLPRRFIVGVGRLEPSKKFDRLIRSFAASGLPHSLVILGEGSQRPMLQALVEELGLSSRVLLPGYLLNPFAVVARADFFVSSSSNEGFPNAMVEAMVLGVPVVATDCRSGPAEVLASVAKLDCKGATEADYGILVEEGSLDALTDGMRRMAEPRRRADYAARAQLRAADFSLEKIASEYWKLFDQVARH